MTVELIFIINLPQQMKAMSSIFIASILTPLVESPEQRLSIGFLLSELSYHPLLTAEPLSVPFFLTHTSTKHFTSIGESSPIPMQMPVGGAETVQLLHQLLGKALVQVLYDMSA